MTIYASNSHFVAIILLLLIDYPDQIGRMPFRSQGKHPQVVMIENAALAQLDRLKDDTFLTDLIQRLRRLKMRH